MELRDAGENRGSSEGRQTKGIEMMNDVVEGCQAARSEKMESKAVRPGGSGQEDWLGGVTETKIRRSQRLDMCSPMKVFCLFYEETPSHGPIPP